MHFIYHVERIIRQRGIKDSDIDFILEYGTCKGQRAMITNKDCNIIVTKAKKSIDIANRLCGKQIIMDGDSVITAYHGSSAQQSRFMSYK